MSKRGSRIARRVLHTMALISISKNKNGSAKNPVLRDYYLKSVNQSLKWLRLVLLCTRFATSYLPYFVMKKSFKSSFS